VVRKGVKTDGAMAPEITLDRQRPAEYVFSRHVEQALAEEDRASPKRRRAGG
jgi:hypothetical protein